MQQAVKYHSISEAAEQNYISQSTFSSSISKLEKELGMNLLKRTARGIEPTEFGKFVLEKAEVIFQARDEILEASNNADYAGTIKLNCIPGIYYRVLPETIRELNQAQSKLVLSVTTAESREIAGNVSTGHANLGIVVKGSYLNSFTDLKYTALFRDEYLLYIGKHSSLWEKEKVTYQEACSQQYIAYRDEFRKENGGLTGVFPKGESPNIVFRTDDLDFMKQMITNSCYTAFFPKFMAAGDVYLQNGMIRALPVSDYDMGFEVGYLESRKFKLTYQERAVVDVLSNTVKALQNQKEEGRRE